MQLKLLTSLKPEEMEQVTQFLKQNFDPTTTLSSEERVVEDDKYGSTPAAYLLGFEDNMIVATIFLHKRKVAYANQEIIVGGCGAVCVHKKYRNKGIGKQMLQEAVKTLREWKCDIGLLCTDTSTWKNFYASAGFVWLPTPYIYYGITSGKKYTEDEGMIVELNNHKIFQKLLNTKEPLNIGTGNW